MFRRSDRAPVVASAGETRDSAIGSWVPIWRVAGIVFIAYPIARVLIQPPGPAITVLALAATAMFAAIIWSVARRDVYDREWKHYSDMLGADEVIYLNETGELAEGSRTTIFVERGGKLDTSTVDENDLGALADAHDVDLGALGIGRAGIGGLGPYGYREVRATPSQGRYVVVAGTLPEDQLVDLARSLHAWPGTELRYLDQPAEGPPSPETTEPPAPRPGP